MKLVFALLTSAAAMNPKALSVLRRVGSGVARVRRTRAAPGRPRVVRARSRRAHALEAL